MLLYEMCSRYLVFLCVLRLNRVRETLNGQAILFGCLYFGSAQLNWLIVNWTLK